MKFESATKLTIETEDGEEHEFELKGVSLGVEGDPKKRRGYLDGPEGYPDR